MYFAETGVFENIPQDGESEEKIFILKLTKLQWLYFD